MSPDEMRAYVEEAPLPCDGPRPYDRPEWREPELEEDSGVSAAYGWSARSLAHGLLVLCEEDPTLLDVPLRDEDPSGIEAAFADRLYAAFKARWPEGFDWTGATGFQWGWAHNAVRHILGAEPVGNPAVVTVGVSETDDG